MLVEPSNVRIYHITHVSNLESIIREGYLLSDSLMIARGTKTASIGMQPIKKRRLGLSVKCHPNDMVGDYVPFYLCPRSVMLYIISRRNHPDLVYRGGQEPIVHLEAEFMESVDWANAECHRWAFTLSNAGASYTEFRNRIEQLNEIDWKTVRSNDFSNPLVKEGKQAEFLIHRFFPWCMVRRIGVKSPSVLQRVLRILIGVSHKPVVEILPEWYF